jgi:hypothetical protein
MGSEIIGRSKNPITVATYVNEFISKASMTKLDLN